MANQKDEGYGYSYAMEAHVVFYFEQDYRGFIKVLQTFILLKNFEDRTMYSAYRVPKSAHKHRVEKHYHPSSPAMQIAFKRIIIIITIIIITIIIQNHCLCRGHSSITAYFVNGWGQPRLLKLGSSLLPRNESA